MSNSVDELGLDRSKINVLISVAHWDDKIEQSDIWKAQCMNLFLDSGAFTNFTKGKEVVSMASYQQFLRDRKDRIWKYINLDIIGDSAGSQRNYEELRANGFDPVPVFTKEASLSSSERKQALFEMSKTSNFITLGGVAGELTKPATKNYIRGCAHFLHKQKTKFHILGCGSPPIIKSVLPYSCDSSSYCMGNKFGLMSLFFNGKFYSVNRDTIKNKQKTPSIVLKKYYMTEHHRKSAHTFEKMAYDFRMVRGILSYLNFQKYLREKYNSEYFLAMSPNHMSHLKEAMVLGGMWNNV